MNAVFRYLVLTGLFAWTSLASAGINSWTMTGPDGGPVATIAIHPTQSQIAMAGTARGLYRTSNGGDSWTLVNEWAYPSAQRIVFDPTNPSRVFAVNGSIWRSDNVGQTFSVRAAPLPYNAQQLEITPTGTMYVGGGGGYFFKSTDHGDTWTACARPFGNNVDSPVFTVDPNPHPQDWLYLNIRSAAVPAMNGTWRSVDGCASWIAPSPGSPGSSGPPGNVTDYAVMPGNPNRVLATSNNGVAVSDDAGVSWTTTWHWNAWGVEFDPTTPGRVFALERISRVIVSTDNGNTWSFGGNAGVVGPVQIALDPQVPGRMFTTSNVGPMLSTDAGVQFVRRATGIRSGTVGSFSAAHDGTVYATMWTGPDGVYRRDPASGAWQPVNNVDLLAHYVGIYAPVMSSVSVARTDSSHVYAGIFETGLLRSTTGGATWEPPHAAFLPLAEGGINAVVDPDDSQIAFAYTAHEGLWKTVDGGLTWNRSNNGLAARVGPVAIAPSDSRVAYVASVPAGSSVPERVYKSTDGGASWSPTGPTPTTPNTNEYVISITIDPTDANVVYAGLHNRLFKTTDGGVSWTPTTFPGTTVIVNPSHPGTLVVPGSRGAFQRTVDGGVTWAATGLPASGGLYMGHIVISPDRPNRIIAGPLSGGVAEYEIATDLEVTVSGISSPLPAEGTVTATVTVRNLGIHAASPPDLAIIVPNWTTPAPPAGCTFAAAVVRCDVGPLQPGAERVWQLPLEVLGPGSSASLVASIATHETELDSTNNTVTMAVTASEIADLSLTLAANPAPLDRGTTAALAATLTNHGPTISTNTTLSLSIPAGLSVQSVSTARGTCTPAAGSIQCAIGTLAFNESVAVTVQLAGVSAGTHSVTGDVDGTGTDGDMDQHASLDIVVRPVSDIGVTLAESADPVTVGASFSYTVTVRNLGTDAGGVHLTVPVRAATITGVTPSTGTCAIAAGSVACDVASLAAGSVMTVVINLSAAIPDIATATATATFAGVDTNPADNVANIGTTMRLVGDVSVEITDDRDPVRVGSNYTYTVTVRNAGPSAGPVSVAIDANLVSLSNFTAAGGICQPTNAPVRCEFASLASGAAAIITMTANTSMPGAAGATAVATFGGYDPDATNNTALASTLARLEADASVEIVDSADPVLVGVPFTYTVTARNLGPSSGRLNLSVPVAGAAVIAAVPSNGGTCTTTAAAVDCQFDSVPSGTAVTVAVSVNTTATGTASATATVGFNGTELVPGNNSATASTLVRLEADASVEIVDSADPVTVGVPFTYTVTARNLGPSSGRLNLSVPVTGAAVTAAVPSNGSTCTTTAASVDCQFDSVPSGTGVTVVVSVNTTATGTASASATVSFNGTELVPGNNSASASTTISAAPPPPPPPPPSSSSSSSGGGGGGGGRLDWLVALLLGGMLLRRVVRG